MLRTVPVVVIIIAAISRCALDQLVDLTTIEPYAAALRTEIDFDALTVADHQVGLTLRALH